MNLTLQTVLVVIASSASITTAIFWAAFYLGDYRRQMISLREDFQKHCNDYTIHIDRRHEHAHSRP